MIASEKFKGQIIVGWFFLMLGLVFVTSNLEFLSVARDSFVLALIYIITGYYIITSKELGRRLAVFLSTLNLIEIIRISMSPKIRPAFNTPTNYSICNMQTGSAWSTYIAIILYALVIYFFTRPQVKMQFSDDNKNDYVDSTIWGIENKETSAKFKALETEIVRLHATIIDKNNIIEEYRTEQRLQLPIEDPVKLDESLEIKREQRSKKIGEILLEQNLITQATLEKALEHQRQFGGSITQYLLYHGYIDDRQLAQCLCAKFGVPYLPLGSYTISDNIIRLVPVDIAEKYWLIPVDKQGDSLMVVMIDPLDIKIIKQLEEVTGLKIKPFVGIISEIANALQVYYKILAKDDKSPLKIPPFFIDTKVYKGIERRHSIRYNAKIDIKFPAQDKYRASKTINVSRDGFAFASQEALSLGAIITVEINLPQPYSTLPISAIAQVVRCFPQQDEIFEVGVKTLKISKQELGIIIDYAAHHAQ